MSPSIASDNSTIGQRLSNSTLLLRQCLRVNGASAWGVKGKFLLADGLSWHFHPAFGTYPLLTPTRPGVSPTSWPTTTGPASGCGLLR